MLFFANIWGWIVANPVKFALYVFAVLGLIYVVTWFACGKRSSIDIKNVEKINSENRTERLKELQNVVEDNANVVKTVDGRTTIAETNVTERNAAVDAKVKEADKKIQEAKQQGQNVTSEQLECMLLTPDKCQ